MIRALSVVLALGLAGPAAAHSLRVFATVEGPTITGYGFFVGGGRPEGVAWIARMADHEVAEGKTDANGGFTFPTPDPVTAPLTITVNSGEGHIASRSLGLERFGLASDAPQSAPSPVQPQASQITVELVQTAVAREVAPLMERIEEMDSRMRLTDAVSAVCLIFGIAGIALWARSRRS